MGCEQIETSKSSKHKKSKGTIPNAIGHLKVLIEFPKTTGMNTPNKKIEIKSDSVKKIQNVSVRKQAFKSIKNPLSIRMEDLGPPLIIKKLTPRVSLSLCKNDLHLTPHRQSKKTFKDVKIKFDKNKVKRKTIVSERKHTMDQDNTRNKFSWLPSFSKKALQASPLKIIRIKQSRPITTEHSPKTSRKIRLISVKGTKSHKTMIVRHSYTNSIERVIKPFNVIVKRSRCKMQY